MTVTETETRCSVEMGAAELGTLLKSALASVGNDSARPILNSVRLELATGTLRTVSTDSYTLLIQDVPAPNCVTRGTFLIPAATCKEWAKVLTSRDNRMLPATLTHDAGTLTLTVPGATLTARAEEGTFPAYDTLVPAESDYLFERGAVNAAYTARMADITVPGYDAKQMKSVAWSLVSFSARKASVWTCNAVDYSATFLQMPVRVP